MLTVLQGGKRKSPRDLTGVDQNFMATNDEITDSDLSTPDGRDAVTQAQEAHERLEELTKPIVTLWSDLPQGLSPSDGFDEIQNLVRLKGIISFWKNEMGLFFTRRLSFASVGVLLILLGMSAGIFPFADAVVSSNDDAGNNLVMVELISSLAPYIFILAIPLGFLIIDHLSGGYKQDVRDFLKDYFSAANTTFGEIGSLASDTVSNAGPNAEQASGPLEATAKTEDAKEKVKKSMRFLIDESIMIDRFVNKIKELWDSEIDEAATFWREHRPRKSRKRALLVDFIPLFFAFFVLSTAIFPKIAIVYGFHEPSTDVEDGNGGSQNVGMILVTSLVALSMIINNFRMGLVRTKSDVKSYLLPWTFGATLFTAIAIVVAILVDEENFAIFALAFLLMIVILYVRALLMARYFRKQFYLLATSMLLRISTSLGAHRFIDLYTKLKTKGFIESDRDLLTKICYEGEITDEQNFYAQQWRIWFEAGRPETGVESFVKQDKNLQLKVLKRRPTEKIVDRFPQNPNN